MDKLKLLLKSSAVTAAVLVFSGYAYAVFSASISAVNIFSIAYGETDGSGGAIIEEPAWDDDSEGDDSDDDGVSDLHSDLGPGDSLDKDPVLISDTGYNAWGFIKAEVPTIEASLSDGSDEDVYDVVTYDVNDGWVLIGSQVSSDAGTDSIYIYAYDTVLAPGDSTNPLFDEITVQDFSEITVRQAAVIYSLGLTGYLIQSGGYEDSDTYEGAAVMLGLITSSGEVSG